MTRKSLRSATSRLIVTVAAIIGSVIILSKPAGATGNAARGETLYQGCQDCHSIEKNDVGPMHKGVFGRLAGMAPGYSYSPALKNSGIVWTAENLDKWLTDPQEFIPGNRMFYEVESPQDRADIIAFLREKAR